MLLAFDLLNKYKKDSKFIEKDIKSLKKKSDLILRTDDPDENLKTKQNKPVINTLLTQEERHRVIAEKREKRK